MTTCVYSRKERTAAADTQNTTNSGGVSRVMKIETLYDGRIFMGSGHLFTISQCKDWADHGFEEDYRPDFSYFLDDPEDRGFECMVISADGSRVWVVDEELTPYEVFDDLIAIGSGGAYALGALHAGATPEAAIFIASTLDPSTSSPVTTHVFGAK